MTIQKKSQTFAINNVDDIVTLRAIAREFAAELGVGLADRTKLATAVSELARNAIQYANGGEATISDLSTDELIIIYIAISDRGPGIDNLERALCDGFSTSNGLGIGLPGCRRLMDRFSIRSTLGEGTCVEVELHAQQS